MRKFYLENQYGIKFEFTYYHKTLISDISGLGFISAFSYLKHENYYETIGDTFNVTEITGIITYLNGYKGYQDFLNYLSNGKENLKLYYVSEDSFYAYVDIVSLSKSEIKSGGLQSEIIFNKKSYWMKEKMVEITANTESGGKVYSYTYPYKYQNSAFGEISVDVGGHLPAALVIEMIGSVDNPTLKVKKGNSELSELRLIHKRKNTHIKVSGILNEIYMTELVDGMWVDIYHAQDFSKDNFIRLNPGTLRFEYASGLSDASTCKILIQEYYLG